MPQPVTPEMRAAVSAALVHEITAQAEVKRVAPARKGPFTLSDSLTLLVHHELTREETPGEPKTTLGEFVSLLLNKYLEEETIHEYVALKKHFQRDYNTSTNVRLLRGLHYHERNREWMDLNDPASVQRNTVLLKAITLLRENAYHRIAVQALESNNSAEWYDQKFRDPECVDLLLDHPEQYETLINLIIERGYHDGMEVFKTMAANNVPALSNGVL